MELLKALVLAVVQGLTEFLPISSSGHLVVLESLFEMKASEYLFFDVLLHLATLLAVCIFYRVRLWGMVLSLNFSNKSSDAVRDRQWIFAIFLSTVITGTMVILFKDKFEQARDNLVIVGFSFLATGALLFSTRFVREKDEASPDIPMNFWLFALLMGFVQGIAVLPGISRSGSTVCTSLLLGARVSTALEYSFLMSIPAILAAAVLELPDATPSFPAYILALGFIASLVSGVVFLKLLVWIVKHGKLHHFAYYVIPLGLWILWISL
ncbi:MAG: undecaprenyl-diphosphate phosphatase [Candidatus Hinthialibacter antarcticus]|nr:undecaprenyl-diphosphate phosphatase [Candidatus Hinthialibacter antarcticus]